MKSIYLVRHGKSSWANINHTDRERILKSRGCRDAKLMAEKVKDDLVMPIFILSSPAVRAHETAKIFSAAFEYEIEKIIIDERLYFHSIHDYLQAIRENTPNKIDTVFSFGHQPTTAALYSGLTNQFLDHLPTSGVAHVLSEVNDWTAIEMGQCQAKAVISPKMFR